MQLLVFSNCLVNELIQIKQVLVVVCVCIFLGLGFEWPKKRNGKSKKKKKFYCEVKGVVYMLTIKYLHMNRCVYATQSSLATSSLIVSTLQCRLMKYRKRK